MRAWLPQPLVHRSWWWIFALFIATPAVALALLGLGSFRAEEIENQQRVRDQQAQLRKLIDVALIAALDREAAKARDAWRGPAPQVEHTADSQGALVFGIDERKVVSFPVHRVYVADVGAEPPIHASRTINSTARGLVAAAKAAEAQGRTAAAVALYQRLQAVPELRAWADLRLLITRSGHAGSAALISLSEGMGHSDAVSPSGIPLAILVSSMSQDLAPSERRRFIPLLQEALQNLRRGRWWLELFQRRAYDAALRRWLAEPARVGSATGPDERLDTLRAAAELIAEGFDENLRLGGRAQVVGQGAQRTMLLWTPPTEDAKLWTGVAIPGRRASELFAEVIEPLQKDLSFRVALRDQHAVLWGHVTERSDPDNVQPIPSIPGWALVFGEIERPAVTPWRRVLNYARVVFPMVVLACGLLMTGWIRQRELALTELQSTFVAAVTHEFKSPITSIRLMMERITGGRMVAGDSPARYYAAISAETDRLEALVNRLLDAQQVQSGRKTYAFRRTALEAVLREALERMRPQAEAKQIDLQLQIAPGVPPLLLDSESVFDAVRNLLENAIKYSPAGTRVDVSLEVSDEHVVLTVSDQGIGVAEADAQRIFEPFYRSHHADVVNVHGTGLGLSLVRATALAHGGSASVSSDGTHGSRFRLAIPLIQDVVQPASPAAVTLVDERRGQSS